MPKAPSVTIRGIKEVRRAFRALPDRLAKKVIRQSLRAGLKLVKEQAVRNAPKGEHGAIKKGIKVRAFAKRKRGLIGLEVRVGDRDFVGKTFYAAMVEYGTVKQPAQGYMRRAFDSRGREALNLAISLIRQGIEREAKALRRAA